MRVLITNDDGIDALGLKIMHAIAVEVVGDREMVTTIAPATEHSSVGHCTTHSKGVSLQQIDRRRYAINGTPADCVIAALFYVMADYKPDIILSGVNAGNNAAQNTLYSGTVGAAIESVIHSIPSIALSQFYHPTAQPNDDIFAPARAYGVHVIKKIIKSNIWHNKGMTLFYNVNFPPVIAKNVKGQKVTKQGMRPIAPVHAKMQNNQLHINSTDQFATTIANSDVAANLAGYIAITPCHIDLTAHSHISQLKTALNDEY